MSRNSFPVLITAMIALLTSGLPVLAEEVPAAGTAWAETPQEDLSLGRKKKAEEQKGSGQGSPSGSQKKDDPPFDEVIKDFEKVDGLFTVYHKDGRHLMAIRPEQLDRDYMVSVTRETGIGQSFLLAAQVLGDGPVRFTRVGKRIQILMKNPRFAATDDPDVRRAVDKSFSDSLLGSAKIESAPQADTNAILIELAPMVLTDVEGVSIILGQVLQTPYTMDRENSYVSQVKGFPSNVEVSARLHFTSNRPANFVNLPDVRSMFVTYRYSLTEVPAAPDYVPRIADDRVGHFLALYQDFSDDRRDTPYVRYVTRWNLQKEEPYAAMSRPKEPITYWLENSIPRQYRKAVADGILVWNKAFEKIGFKDAIVVKQQPDDADWDPADTRYATVRWFVTTDSSFAIGPSRINPMTGQIYDADIGVSEAIVRNARSEYQELVDPVAALQGMAEAMQPATLSGRPTLGLGGTPADPRFLCTMGMGAAMQAAFGRSLLGVRGMTPGSPEEEKYVNDFLVHVMAHEVGHTLGLRHNFRASAVLPFEQLQDTARTASQGLTGSVMDYIPVNIAPKGVKQGDHWQTTLGPYDMWAIEYAYTQYPGVKKPEDELPQLRAIATRVAELGNHYGTDEDTSEPRTSQWDIGADAMAFHQTRVDLSRELWAKIPTTFAREGEGYQVMRRAFLSGMFEYLPTVINVTKYIGGLHSHRDHVGDPQGRLPFEPVPADRQREALKFLRANLYDSNAFRLPPDLLNRLAANRWWDFNFSVFSSQRMELPLHDIVLQLQQMTLNQLYGPVKLDRLVDLEMQFPKGQKPFTIGEMFDGLQQSIWSELYASGSPRIDSFRRALQREHLKKLIDLVVRPAQGVPEDAGTMARAGLSDLKGRIDTALRGQAAAGLDSGTRAHLDETRARIEAALSAGMLRLTS